MDQRSLSTTSRSDGSWGSSQSLGSTRTRIIAPMRDRKGEPIGNQQVFRPSVFLDGSFRSTCATTDRKLSPFDDMESTAESTTSSERKLERDIEQREERAKPRVTKSVLYESREPQNYFSPKRSDPVKLYHQYEAYWKAHGIPGDDPRKELRWNIRSMLMTKDYETPVPAKGFAYPAEYKDGKRIPRPRRWSSQDTLDDFTSDFSSATSSKSGSTIQSNWTPPPPSSFRRPERNIYKLMFGKP
ncbi:hypothetical protein RvY_17394 [Ramazzottius varieornatus]|uniref:Centriolar and ciliogenesis-associated protein HYLS1 C-terminal domain-containing protein n=1 Tax=Ramazzottius varieornatus TaxID=947166 RepID=A0A1D1W1Z8_RAMVA|nr:hypothetical protein RvY_17394 [Ramazzottius varieornatus]